MRLVIVLIVSYAYLCFVAEKSLKRKGLVLLVLAADCHTADVEKHLPLLAIEKHTQYMFVHKKSGTALLTLVARFLRPGTLLI